MKTSDFNEWLRDRLEFQTKIVMGAIAGMLVLGLLGLLIEGGFMYLMLQWYGTAIAIVMILGIFGGLTFWVSKSGPEQYRDKRYKAHITGEKVVINVAPSIAHAWTFAFGSMESDQSIPEWIFNLALIVPRLFWTSWQLKQRITDVNDIDIEEASKALRMILKKAERVEVQEIAHKYPDMDIPTTMRHVSLIDGVVFLTKEGVGLSLANRFKDDLEKWLDEQKGTTSDQDEW